MKMYKDKATAVAAIVNDYFDGIFYGDIDKLRNSFTSNAHIYGDIRGEEYSKSLDEYLKGVAGRKSPNELEEEKRMELLGIEIIGNVALAKAHSPMLGFNYYDFLSLSLVQGQWKIVNKVFTHVE